MNSRNSIRTNHKGFTLIELLVVVLILSILMAVALPLYLSAVADSQKKTCRANMQTIANAVVAARVRTAAASYTTLISDSAAAISLTDISDLNSVPTCPSAGTYTLVNGSVGGGVDFAVSCSVAAHGTFQPGVDHN
jgi:type IV pilus assembly protein PilA